MQILESQENRFWVLYLSKIDDVIKYSSQAGLELPTATNIQLPRSQVIDEVLNSQTQIQTQTLSEIDFCINW